MTVKGIDLPGSRCKRWEPGDGPRLKTSLHFHRNSKRRHERRARLAELDLPRMQRWCDKTGISLRVYDSGRCWEFRKDPQRARWTPSTANLRYKPDWYCGDRAEKFHLHDIDQVRAVLHARMLAREP